MKQKKPMKTVGEVIAILFMIVFPLFVWTDYSDITAMKLAFSTVCIVGFLLAFVFCKFMLRSDRWEYLPDLFLFLFLCSGTISWFMSPYFGETNADGFDYNLFGAGRFDGLIFLGLYAVLYWLTARYCRLQKQLIRGFALIMLVMCIIAVVQLSGINALNLYPTGSYKGHPNSFLTTIGNVDVVSGFMCMMLPMVGVSYVVLKWDRLFSALFLAAHTVAVYVMLSMDADMCLVGLVALLAVMTPILIRSRESVQKMLELGVSLAFAAAAAFAIDYPFFAAEKCTKTVFTFTMGTAVALMVALVLLGARLMMHYTPAFDLKWNRVQWLVVGLEALAVVGGFCYFRFACDPATTTGLMKDLSELVRGELSDTAGTHRIGIWRHALQMAKENLWFGTGCGTFGESFKEFAELVGYTRYVDRNLDFAHNEYVHLLCTMGVVGLTGYVGFLLTMAWRAVRYMYRNPKILILGACAFGYSVWVFFCFSIPIVTPLFWVLMGMLAVEIRQTANGYRHEDEETLPDEEDSLPPEGEEPAQSEEEELPFVIEE